MIHNLTHYDLDGAVCYILLQSFIPKINAIPVGYTKLSDVALKFVKEHKKSIITDLSLDQDMIDLIKETQHNILLIDHHETSLPFKEQETENFKVYINVKYCGAANVLKYFKGKQKFSESLKTLAYLTNDYDMWMHREPDSKILNFIFWKRGFNAFCEMFKNGYDADIVNAFRSQYQRDEDIKIGHLEKSEKYIFEENGNKLLMIFCLPGIINDVTIHFKDFDYYVIIPSTPKKISVRCSDDKELPTAFKKYSENKHWIDNIGCHKHAGGITYLKNLKEEELFDAYENLCETLLETS